MKNLNYKELLTINGGNDVPVVSCDPSVQDGYDYGYYIGRAIGNTVRLFKKIF